MPCRKAVETSAGASQEAGRGMKHGAVAQRGKGVLVETHACVSLY